MHGEGRRRIAPQGTRHRTPIVHYVETPYPIQTDREERSARIRRILVVALPVAAVWAVLAHWLGVGWFFFDCVTTPSGSTGCGGFIGSPVFWGPLGGPIVPLGHITPTPARFAFAVLWWLLVGAFVGYVFDTWFRRRGSRLRARGPSSPD